MSYLPPLDDPTKRKTAQIYSSYSYVFAAMAEGLKEILATPGVPNHIPPAVLSSVKELFQEAIEATRNKPPYNPVRSAFLWSMVMENLPQKYQETRNKDLLKGRKSIARKVGGLTSLVKNLKKFKKIPDTQRESYLTLQQFFQSLSDKSEGYGELLRYCDDDDE